MRRISSVTLALIVAAIAAPSAGAASWAKPVTIPAGSALGFDLIPLLTFTPDGRAVVAFASGLGTAAPVLAAAPGSDRFARIGRAAVVDAPAPYGRNRVALLRTTGRPPGVPPPAHQTSAGLGVSLASFPGGLGRLHALASVDVSTFDLTARIAADPRGDVAVAWLQAAGSRAQPGRALVRLALRPAGHPFARPTTIGTAFAGEDRPVLGLAYGANGDLLVAFEQTRSAAASSKTLRLAVRVKRHGARLGPIQTLGPTEGITSLALAVGPNGRAVVGWGTTAGGANIDLPWTVRAALLGVRGQRFSAFQLLDPGGAVFQSAGGVSAAIGPRGTATVAWSGVPAGNLTAPVRVAAAGPTGGFGPTTQLSPNGVVLGVVTASDETTTVAFGPISGPGSPLPRDGILSSRRVGASGPFALPEAVFPPAPTLETGFARDPATNGLAAIWFGAPTLPPGAPIVDPGTPIALEYSTHGP